MHPGRHSRDSPTRMRSAPPPSGVREVYHASVEECASQLAIVETAGIGSAVNRVRHVQELLPDDPRYQPRLTDNRDAVFASADLATCVNVASAQLGRLVSESVAAAPPAFPDAPAANGDKYATMKLKVGVNGGEKFVVNRHGRSDLLECALLQPLEGEEAAPTVVSSKYVTANVVAKVTGEAFRVKLFMTPVPADTKGELPTFSVKVDRGAPFVRWSRPKAALDARVTLDHWTSLRNPDRALALEVVEAYKLWLGAPSTTTLESIMAALPPETKHILKNLREITSREYVLPTAPRGAEAACAPGSVEFCAVRTVPMDSREAAASAATALGSAGLIDTEVFLRVHEHDRQLSAALRALRTDRSDTSRAAFVQAVAAATRSALLLADRLDPPQPMRRGECKLVVPAASGRRDGARGRGGDAVAAAATAPKSAEERDAAAFAVHRKHTAAAASMLIDNASSTTTATAAMSSPPLPPPERVRNALGFPAFASEAQLLSAAFSTARIDTADAESKPLPLTVRKPPRFHLRRLVCVGGLAHCSGLGVIVALPRATPLEEGGAAASAELAILTTTAVADALVDGAALCHLDGTPALSTSAGADAVAGVPVGPEVVVSVSATTAPGVAVVSTTDSVACRLFTRNGVELLAADGIAAASAAAVAGGFPTAARPECLSVLACVSSSAVATDDRGAALTSQRQFSLSALHVRAGGEGAGGGRGRLALRMPAPPGRRRAAASSATAGGGGRGGFDRSAIDAIDVLRGAPVFRGDALVALATQPSTIRGGGERPAPLATVDAVLLRHAALATLRTSPQLWVSRVVRLGARR